MGQKQDKATAEGTPGADEGAGGSAAGRRLSSASGDPGDAAEAGKGGGFGEQAGGVGREDSEETGLAELEAGPEELDPAAPVLENNANGPPAAGGLREEGGEGGEGGADLLSQRESEMRQDPPRSAGSEEFGCRTHSDLTVPKEGMASKDSTRQAWGETERRFRIGGSNQQENLGADCPFETAAVTGTTSDWLAKDVSTSDSAKEHHVVQSPQEFELQETDEGHQIETSSPPVIHTATIEAFSLQLSTDMVTCEERHVNILAGGREPEETPFSETETTGGRISTFIDQLQETAGFTSGCMKERKHSSEARTLESSPETLEVDTREATGVTRPQQIHTFEESQISRKPEIEAGNLCQDICSVEFSPVEHACGVDIKNISAQDSNGNKQISQMCSSVENDPFVDAGALKEPSIVDNAAEHQRGDVVKPQLQEAAVQKADVKASRQTTLKHITGDTAVDSFEQDCSGSQENADEAFSFTDTSLKETDFDRTFPLCPQNNKQPDAHAHAQCGEPICDNPVVTFFTKNETHLKKEKEMLDSEKPHLARVGCSLTDTQKKAPEEYNANNESLLQVNEGGTGEVPAMMDLSCTGGDSRQEMREGPTFQAVRPKHCDQVESLRSNADPELSEPPSINSSAALKPRQSTVLTLTGRKDCELSKWNPTQNADEKPRGSITTGGITKRRADADSETMNEASATPESKAPYKENLLKEAVALRVQQIRTENKAAPSKLVQPVASAISESRLHVAGKQGQEVFPHLDGTMTGSVSTSSLEKVTTTLGQGDLSKGGIPSYSADRRSPSKSVCKHSPEDSLLSNNDDDQQKNYAVLQMGEMHDSITDFTSPPPVSNVFPEHQTGPPSIPDPSNPDALNLKICTTVYAAHAQEMEKIGDGSSAFTETFPKETQEAPPNQDSSSIWSIFDQGATGSCSISTADVLPPNGLDLKENTGGERPSELYTDVKHSHAFVNLSLPVKTADHPQKDAILPSETLLSGSSTEEGDKGENPQSAVKPHASIKAEQVSSGTGRNILEHDPQLEGKDDKTVEFGDGGPSMVSPSPRVIEEKRPVHPGQDSASGAEIFQDVVKSRPVSELIKETIQMQERAKHQDRVRRPEENPDGAFEQGQSVTVAQMKKAFDVPKKPQEKAPERKPSIKKVEGNSNEHPMQSMD